MSLAGTHVVQTKANRYLSALRCLVDDYVGYAVVASHLTRSIETVRFQILDKFPRAEPQECK